MTTLTEYITNQHKKLDLDQSSRNNLKHVFKNLLKSGKISHREYNLFHKYSFSIDFDLDKNIKQDISIDQFLKTENISETPQILYFRLATIFGKFLTLSETTEKSSKMENIKLWYDRIANNEIILHKSFFTQISNFTNNHIINPTSIYSKIVTFFDYSDLLSTIYSASKFNQTLKIDLSEIETFYGLSFSNILDTIDFLNFKNIDIIILLNEKQFDNELNPELKYGLILGDILKNIKINQSDPIKYNLITKIFGFIQDKTIIELYNNDDIISISSYNLKFKNIYNESNGPKFEITDKIENTDTTDKTNTTDKTDTTDTTDKTDKTDTTNTTDTTNKIENSDKTFEKRNKTTISTIMKTFIFNYNKHNNCLFMNNNTALLLNIDETEYKNDILNLYYKTLIHEKQKIVKLKTHILDPNILNYKSDKIDFKPNYTTLIRQYGKSKFRHFKRIFERTYHWEQCNSKDIQNIACLESIIYQKILFNHKSSKQEIATFIKNVVKYNLKRVNFV